MVTFLMVTVLVNGDYTHAAGNSCAVASCGGTYNNGFCSKCGGYETAKPVSSTHYNEYSSTNAGYYAIENAGQLYWFAEFTANGNASANAILVSDITVNKNVLDSNGRLNTSKESTFRAWVPICSGVDYEGKFEGNNHTVSGLYCNSFYENSGFIGSTIDTEIHNLNITDSYFRAGRYMGGIVGYVTGKTYITNCSFVGFFEKKDNDRSNHIGGIVGGCDYGLRISNCNVTADIVADVDNNGSFYAGGIAGDMGDGRILDSYHTGDITAAFLWRQSHSYIGGIAGNSTSIAARMENSIHIGDIYAKYTDETYLFGIGGLVGVSDAELRHNCAAIGDIHVDIAEFGTINSIGGLVGDEENNENRSCYYSGSITVTGPAFDGVDASSYADKLHVGALVGLNRRGNLTYCYYNSDKYTGPIIGQDDTNQELRYADGKTTAQFASGEVTYLLNERNVEDTDSKPLMWYQTIGTDAYPTLEKTSGRVLYQDGKYFNLEENPDLEEIEKPDINVSYRTHIQTFGWEGNADNIKTWKSNGAMSGTSGLSKRLEGINIVVNPKVVGSPLDLGVQYTTHCQSYGWLPWSANGEMNGTEGESKRLEAIKIQLTGADKDKYDIYYRVHAQTYGWLGWAKNGAPAGTAGYAKRLEGIQIVVVKKSESFNQKMEGITSAKTEAFVAKAGNSPIVNYPATSNTNPVVPGADTVNVAYRTHVQSYGWQAWKYNGQMSGTSGKSKRLEGINIELRNQAYAGDIVYTTHVQKYGWQGKLEDQSTWKKNGEMSGTSGEAKRLEAICINLTGEMSQKYDIYYRVHAQSYGWLGWAKNGEPSGTAGYGKRLEGIQIVLVPKGGTAPGNYQGITSVRTEAYVKK